MKIIVCIDDQGGVLFNHRRVSSDQMVIANILEYIGDSKLYVSQYSMKLFSSVKKFNLLTDLSAVEDDSCVFLEENMPKNGFERVREVIVYHWNRLYPSDVRFPIVQLRKSGRLKSATEFKGNSHEKITREVYTL
jgi:hypothetical protein